MWAEDAILRNALEKAASAHPDREVVTFETGHRWTAAEALAQARSAADALQAHGVCAFDVVAVSLPNGADYLRAWWGTHLLGAVLAPLNIGWTGRLLGHVLSVADARLVVSEGRLRDEIERVHPEASFVPPARLTEGDRSFAGPSRRPELEDQYRLMATSGTTGPSKVWMTNNLQAQSHGTYVQAAGLTDRDRFLVDLPLFHNAAMGAVSKCLLSGTPVTVRSKPSLSRYLEVARETGATMAYLVGSMAAKLMATPATDADRDHPLRALAASPTPPDVHAFARRFGISEIITGYGTTESGGCLSSGGGGLPAPGSCGRPEPGYQVRIVDENDHDVAPGVVGECVVRGHDPRSRLGYYVGDQAATTEIWRAGWLHTGDLLRRDEAGTYYFVDRAKDALRRRGENISSFEVEAEVREHPGVVAVACVAAPAEGEGDEVKVWLVAKPGVQLDLGALAQFLSERMARFMVPRFYEVVDELPLTNTMRVQKNVLRERGNSAATWDRETGTYCAYTRAPTRAPGVKRTGMAAGPCADGIST
jgi:crotonobetaine/carnitine-CoA ligase